MLITVIQMLLPLVIFLFEISIILLMMSITRKFNKLIYLFSVYFLIITIIIADLITIYYKFIKIPTNSLQSIIEKYLYLGLEASMKVITFILFIFITQLITNEISNRLRMFFYPIPLIADNMILIIQSAEETHDNWIKLKHKRNLFLQLEISARCFENYIPRQLHSGDIVTDTQIKETARWIAAALREKKEWVFTPKKTPSYLATHIANTLTFMIIGDWDALEKAHPKKLSQPQLWHKIAR